MYRANSGIYYYETCQTAKSMQQQQDKDFFKYLYQFTYDLFRFQKSCDKPNMF